MLDLERRRNEVDSPRNDVDHHVDYVFPLRPFISPAKDTEAVANQKKTHQLQNSVRDERISTSRVSDGRSQ